MTKALKTFTIPEIKGLGFSGIFPHFRRNKNNRFEFASFQFNKYGGSFIMECGFVKPADIYESKKVLPFEKLNYGDANWKNRIRIKPEQAEEDFWFSYSKFKDKEQFEELAKSLNVLLPQVEGFFQN